MLMIFSAFALIVSTPVKGPVSTNAVQNHEIAMKRVPVQAPRNNGVIGGFIEWIEDLIP